MKSISMLVSIILSAACASATSYDYIEAEERAAIRSLIHEFNDFLETRTPPKCADTGDQCYKEILVALCNTKCRAHMPSIPQCGTICQFKGFAWTPLRSDPNAFVKHYLKDYFSKMEKGGKRR
jgi:hypothetical protein